MGGELCLPCTNPEQAREINVSMDIDTTTRKEKKQQAEVLKLLLLGAGDSGKSTLFKQMIKLYGKGFSKEDRLKFVPIVYSNTIAAIQTLIRNTERLQVKHSHLATLIQAENRVHANVIMQLKIAGSDVTSEVGYHIKALWQDPGIQCTFANRSKFQLNDNADWFFDRIDEISKADYCPSEGDILRARVRTTGIVETEFELESHRFRMIDVGGQRNERNKWIHCFEHVTAVIFVAAMSAYDQGLYEDGSTNRVHEALNLFASVCNSEWFEHTPIILFLNKSDLFAEKIKFVNIDICFPSYFGKQEFEPCAQYIQQAFESRNLNTEKPIYTHITCATDSENINRVFNATKNIVIRGSLGSIGLM